MTITAREAGQRLETAAESGALARLCRRHGIDLMVLFGSAARAESDPADVDVAIAARPGTRLDLLVLLQDLYELTAYEDFDVLDLDRAGPIAKERALVGARLLHEGSHSAFASRQIAAVLERIDTAEMRRIELELMAR